MNKKVLVGIPVKHHVLLAEDEIQGLKDIGYTCYTIVYSRNDQSVSKINKLLGVFKRSFRMVEALYKFSPDLLYLNSRFEPVATMRDFISIAVIRMVYFKKLKIAVKTHGSDLSVLSDNSFFTRCIMLPFITRHVDIWFFLSQDEKDIIGKYNSTMHDKVYITSNIINPARSVASDDFKKRYMLDGNKFNILFAGRIVKEKGVFDIIKSIPLLEYRNDCNFIFVGDGPDFEELKILADTLNVTKLIRFLGFIPDEECDHFYANTDVLLFPTFFNEGFPMVLFKSVASGLPVITTKIRAAKDHLQSPDNVIWVAAESATAIANAITLLYNNQPLRETMSKNNKKMVQNLHVAGFVQK
jgi:glycosyltransferase involved in cell wall biosynthesis